MNKLKDLFFGSEESEDKHMGTEDMNKDAAGAAQYITSDMLVGDIIIKHPVAAQFLMECGMSCIYCPASQMESLLEACAVHGIDGEEITDALNDYIAEHNG